jgi:predicted GIY-YIG superfamily endonuclease
MKWTVYCITLRNGKRYIGVTSKGWRTRLEQHVYAAQRGGCLTLHCAIRKYGVSGGRTLAICDTEADAKIAEVAFIKQYKTIRPYGYNSTEGGNGVIDPSGLSETIRVERMQKTMATAAYKRKQHRIQQRVWTPERCARRSREIRKLWRDPKYRASLVKAHKGHVHTSDQKRKLKASLAEYYSDPKHREEQVARLYAVRMQPGVEERRLAGLRAARLRPDVEARRLAAFKATIALRRRQRQAV